MQEKMVAQSLDPSVYVDANSSVPVDEQILENCLGTGKGTYFRGFSYGKKAPASSSRKRKTSAEWEAELEAERRKSNRVEQKYDELMESVNELKATVKGVLENQRVSSQFMFTPFGGYRPALGSPQQQRRPPYGPFGSLLNNSQPSMFGPNDE